MATGDIIIYNKFKQFLLQNGDGVLAYPVDFNDAGTNVKVLLVDNTYSPNYDTHEDRADLTGEVTGGNYTAGGAAIANKSVTLDTGGDFVYFDGDNVTWLQSGSGFTTARYGIIYKDNGTPSQSPLIALLDLGTARGNQAGDLTINWNAGGIIKLT